MLYKSKLNLSVILLIVGLGIIPTGFFSNGYLRDQVSSEVSVVLTALEEEAISIIEDDYLGLGFSQIFSELNEEEIPELENDVVLVAAIPDSLNFLKNATLERLPGLINASNAAIAMNQTIWDVRVSDSLSEDPARLEFFNDFNYQGNYSSSILGISEYLSGGTFSINFTESSITRLLEGRWYDDITYPGLFDDLLTGTGILDWLEFYHAAESNIGTNRSLIGTVYQCPWASGRLQNLSAYITNYLWDVVAKNQYSPLDLETYSESVFYGQWANASMSSSGFNIKHITPLITVDLFGFEAGLGSPTDITGDTARKLWDPSNSSAFTNDLGLHKWFDAIRGDTTAQDDLMNIFDLSNAQRQQICNWLSSSIRTNVVPRIFALPAPHGKGMTAGDYTAIVYLEQWANGTYVSGGITLSNALKGFEVGIPTATNISLASVIALFDETNSSSFIDRNGILKWVEAKEGNQPAHNELATLFNLNSNQLDMILDWLFTTFRYDVAPNITVALTRSSMAQYAQKEFYRQWADGLLFGEGIEPGPLLGVDSFEGWELGIPVKSYIDEQTSAKLWGKVREYQNGSLVDTKGISKWFKAMKKESTYNVLANFYELTDAQMDSILAWLIDIREDFAILTNQVDSGLPMNNYVLGNTIFTWFTIGGGIIGGIGVLGVILLLLSKRK